MMLWIVATLISWFVLAIAGFAAAIVALTRIISKKQESHENEPTGMGSICLRCWNADLEYDHDWCGLPMVNELGESQ